MFVPRKGWQRTAEDLQAEVLLIADTVAATLDDADFVVEALDKAERHFVLGCAVRGDAIPVAFDQRGKLLERAKPLPAEGAAPCLEELPRPRDAAVLPELPELLLQHVGCVQPLVRREQGREGASLFGAEIGPMGEQDVLLALDELSVVAIRQPFVLGLPDLIHRLAQLPQDMELVVENGGLRRVPLRRVAEGPPHVHDRDLDRLTPGGAELGVELGHARVRPIHAPEPDRASDLQVTDDDPVDMAFANGDFVDADDARRWRPCAVELLLHIGHVHGLHGMPIEPQVGRHFSERHATTQLPHVPREPPRVVRVLGEPRQPLLFHATTRRTADPPDIHGQEHPQIAAG